MTGVGDAGSNRARPGREELEAEVARLRAVLARAGVDAQHAAGETAAARQETRQARDGASGAAAGHARELEAGRAELAGSEALNDALRRVNAALAESEERCRAVVESATDYALVTTDRQGRLTGWNEGARRIMGWSGAEALGRDARMIWTPEDREDRAPEAEMNTALEQGTAADVRWHMKRDGSRFWAQGQLTPLHDGDSGRPRGFLKILRDHTAQRAAERERERLLAMLG
ncbi:MAG: PAS domain-containing protein, partial [Janthinobacterium lividum]